MAYAFRADIDVDYPEFTNMVMDYWGDAVDDAQEAYDTAVSDGDPAATIMALATVLSDAKTLANANANATIDSHLERAKSLIDECIPVRSWVTVPRVLRDMSVDIAVYYMALPADWRTDELRIRFDEVKANLKLYCEGKKEVKGGELEPDELPLTPANGNGGLVTSDWGRS